MSFLRNLFGPRNRAVSDNKDYPYSLFRLMDSEAGLRAFRDYLDTKLFMSDNMVNALLTLRRFTGTDGICTPQFRLDFHREFLASDKISDALSSKSIGLTHHNLADPSNVQQIKIDLIRMLFDPWLKFSLSPEGKRFT